MAGAGFKTFGAGEVLLASEVNTFLMQQAVMVFGSAAARDGVITAPSEGMLCYLKDTNAVEKYTGSDWVAVVGDTSPITTEGDLIVGDASGDPVRLPVGAAGEVLTSDGDTVSFVTPASGGSLTEIVTGSFTGASVALTSIPQTFEHLQLVIENFRPAVDNSTLDCRINNDSGTRYYSVSAGATANRIFSATQMTLTINSSNFTSESLIIVDFFNYANTTTFKTAYSNSVVNNSTTPANVNVLMNQSGYNQTTAITRLDLFPDTGSFTSGTYYLYGIK